MTDQQLSAIFPKYFKQEAKTGGGGTWHFTLELSFRLVHFVSFMFKPLEILKGTFLLSLHNIFMHNTHHFYDKMTIQRNYNITWYE